MVLTPGANLGRFRIVEQIGRGGMATVYKAFQPGLNRYVALKVLLDNSAADVAFQERFQREAILIANLRHPNILTIFDYGTDDGYTYLVCELVEGGTLARRLGRPLPVSEVVALLKPIADALDHAHEHGIVHRDVKPSNVLMAGNGRPVLADFGIARMLDAAPGVTLAGSVIGTPAYMAPEQALGAPTKSAADRYALGIVAFEMLTGRVPFTAETPQAILYAHVHRPLPPPRQVCPGLSAAAETVLLKILAKAPEDRHRTSGAFVAALAATDQPDNRRSAPPPVQPTEIDWPRRTPPDVERSPSGPQPRQPDPGRSWPAGAGASGPGPVSPGWPGHSPSGPRPRQPDSGRSWSAGPGLDGPGADGSGLNDPRADGYGPAGPHAFGPGTFAQESISAAPAVPSRPRRRLITVLGMVGLLVAGGVGGRRLLERYGGELGWSPDADPPTPPAARPPAAPPTSAPVPPTAKPAPPTATSAPPAASPRVPTTTSPSPSPSPAITLASWTRLGSQTATWGALPTGVTARVTDGNAILASPGAYSDVEIEANVSTTNREASLAIRVRDHRNFYLLIFIPDGVPVLKGRSGGIWLYKETDGVGTFLAAGRLASFAQARDTVHLRLVAQGNTLAGFMNAREVARATDATHATGRVGLRVFGDDDGPCDATFTNVRIVTP